MTQCQVLVVGGGPSGLSAAISAARAGADVVLCERYGCFGGVITTVGMETIAWYRYEGCVDTEVRYILILRCTSNPIFNTALIYDCTFCTSLRIPSTFQPKIRTFLSMNLLRLWNLHDPNQLLTVVVEFTSQFHEYFTILYQS